jgi:hypothetical protein
VSPSDVAAGQPFALRVELQNTGVCPWLPGVGQRLAVSGDAARLGLPAQWEYEGPPLVFGERRSIELHGVAPQEPGEVRLTVTFAPPFRNAHPFIQREVSLRWK